MLTPGLGSMVQMPMSWHDGGLFVGMHWIWWTFWIVLLLVIFAAFWRLRADRADTRQAVRDEERAEDLLRRRFAAGEIDQEEYTRRMRILRETMT